MFVAMHRRRREAAGKKPQVKPAAVVVAALSAIVAGVIPDLLHAGRAGFGTGKAVVAALVIGLGAASLGLALARTIGRQGSS